jgi:response regulator RpfG family c-di-GMP phosphodiesterase
VTARLLVAHDADAECANLVAELQAAGYVVDVADGVGPACFMLRRHDYLVVVADLPGADAGALAILRAAGRSKPAARVILMLPAMANGAEPALPELSRAAYRCLRHPVEVSAELVPIVSEAVADYRTERERPARIPDLRRAAAKRPIEDMVEGMIRALQIALEFHDRSAERRPRRVIAMASELARACGIHDGTPAMEDIYRASALSDIGKLGVPSTVLAKQQPLNELDWQELRKHPEHSWRILREIPEFRGAAELLYAARERWDGNGYPRALAGERIPAGARIVAVAVAWDAMTSQRAYRPALSLTDAQREIAEGSGTAYDPVVVEAFERVMVSWTPATRRAADAA